MLEDEQPERRRHQADGENRSISHRVEHDDQGPDQSEGGSDDRPPDCDRQPAFLVGDGPSPGGIVEAGSVEPEDTVGAVGCQSVHAQHVDAALPRKELTADVGRRGEVHDPMATMTGPVDAETATAILGDIEVHVAARPAECADQLVDDSVALGRWDTGDHGQPGVQRKAHRVVSGLDVQSLESHRLPIGPDAVDLRLGWILGRYAALQCVTGLWVTSARPP
jgi:hypothetical protein